MLSVWIKGTENLADAFTKALERPKFEAFLDAAGLDRGHKISDHVNEEGES